MQPTAAPKVSVVIVNYEAWAETNRLVETLCATAAFTGGEAEIIVVDNNSPSGIPADRRQADGLRWIDHPTNGGFAAGVNTGWQQSRGQWLLVLNPDVLLSVSVAGQILALPDNIQTLAGPLLKPERAGIIGFALVNPDGSRQPSVGAFPSLARGLPELFLPRNRRRYQITFPQRTAVVDWVTGAAFLVRADTMAQLGGFDTDYFLYFEETDFCHRAQRAGWATLYEPGIKICHEKPLQNRPASPMIRILTRHSRLLYFRKNRPALEFQAMCLVVRAEACLKYGLSRLGVGTYRPPVWMAVHRLARLFQSGTYPVGEAARDWAAAQNGLTAGSE
ncbi:MAG: glycosyltransferase family 2 protein [bacterium]